MKLRKSQFYILSFSWGLLCTTAGIIAALALMAVGYRPIKRGWCWYFVLGKSPWGGASLGIFCFVDNFSSDTIKNHEFGHAIQNCFLGPLMPLLVSLPSICRYWARTIKRFFGRPVKKAYDSVWFEGQATKLGNAKVRLIEEAKKDR